MNSPTSPAQQTQPSKKIPGWIKILAALCILGAVISIIASFFSTDLSAPVNDQLAAMRANKLTEAYYAYTSREFQETTPLDKFKEFVRENPILLNNTSSVLSEENVDNNTATLKATLYDKAEANAEILYNLIKEDHTWKILGIHLTEFFKETPEGSSETSELIAPVEAQLKALKSNDILGAYKNVVSKQFEEHTPFDKFKAFILQHPILTQFKNYELKEHSSQDSLGLVTIILNPESEAIPIQYRLIKEEGHWKIQLLQINLKTNEESLTSPDSVQMISAVKAQLEALKQKDYDKAYNDYIAKDVQKETTFETFKNFLKTYPALTNYQTINIKEPVIEGDAGQLVVELINEEGTTDVDYTMALKEGVWKVMGMHISKLPENLPHTGTEGNEKGFKTRDLLNVIHGFLNAVRNKDFHGAYNQYTSQNFHDSNSLKDFEEFMQKHPEFIKSSGSSFEKLSFNNNIATFSGKLFLSDKLNMPVEFDLIQDEGKWKILHIFTYPVVQNETDAPASGTPHSSTSSIEFTKVLLGTKVDDEGNIQNPSATFKTDSGDIYVNLFIHNGKAATKIDIVLRHVESSSEIGPVSASLMDNGDSRLSFVFSPPPTGWPKGSYQIKVASSTKVYKTFTFTVN